MISTLTGIAVRRDVAMTGEVTLRGRVLAIGGLKEKLLAALRGGIKTVLIPEENEKDLVEIPANITSGLKIIPVSHVDEVLAVALVSPVVPIEWTEADELAASPPVHSGTDPETAIRPCRVAAWWPFTQKRSEARPVRTEGCSTCSLRRWPDQS